MEGGNDVKTSKKAKKGKLLNTAVTPDYIYGGFLDAMNWTWWRVGLGWAHLFVR